MVYDGIKIEIGATIVNVTKIPPNRSFVKTTINEFWNNSFLRRKTKRYFALKTTELVFRSIGIHQAYLLADEYLLPHLPTIISFLRSLPWDNDFFRIDAGFACGIAAAFVIRRLARSLSDFLTKGMGKYE